MTETPWQNRTDVKLSFEANWVLGARERPEERQTLSSGRNFTPLGPSGRCVVHTNPARSRSRGVAYEMRVGAVVHGIPPRALGVLATGGWNAMKDMWGRVNGTVRSAKRGWYGADGNWAVMPKPLDEPVIEVAGANPANVLLIGDGPAMGYGVTAHDLALPGHLARQLSELTRRGVTVSCIADEHLRMANIEQRYVVFAPAALDAVIVSVGIADATHHTRVKNWTDRLHSFIRRVNKESGGEVSVVLVGVPPVETMPIITGWRAAVAERHVPLLNAELEFASLGYSNVEFLPFAPPPESDPDRYRSARTYGEWAWLISPVVAMSLDRQAHVSAWQRSPHLPSADD